MANFACSRLLFVVGCWLFLKKPATNNEQPATIAPVIETRNLTFSYTPQKRFAFPDVACADDETLLILGRSGRGKTTLLHLLALLLKPESGQIVVNGTDLARLTASATVAFRAQNIGLVYQRPHFVASLSVMDNLLLANYLAGLKPDRARARHLAERLGFSEHLPKKTTQLSLGEQQRVGIARALMNRARVLLADEPTSNLDDDNCDRVATLLAEQAHEVGASLVIVTHDQRLKERVERQVSL